jgi:hypothetical protein
MINAFAIPPLVPTPSQTPTQTVTPTVTTTNTPTPTTTPTNTQTPTQTTTQTKTPTTTPTNTQTPTQTQTTTPTITPTTSLPAGVCIYYTVGNGINISTFQTQGPTNDFSDVQFADLIELRFSRNAYSGTTDNPIQSSVDFNSIFSNMGSGSTISIVGRGSASGVSILLQLTGTAAYAGSQMIINSGFGGINIVSSEGIGFTNSGTYCVEFNNIAPTPTPTPTNTVTPTVTPSNTTTVTPTKTQTPTPSVTKTNTPTPSITTTNTPTPSITTTTTQTQTPTRTVTPTITPTQTTTQNPTNTPTNTVTPSITSTNTPTPSLSVGCQSYDLINQWWFNYGIQTIGNIGSNGYSRSATTASQVVYINLATEPASKQNVQDYKPFFDTLLISDVIRIYNTPDRSTGYADFEINGTPTYYPSFGSENYSYPVELKLNNNWDQRITDDFPIYFTGTTINFFNSGGTQYTTFVSCI